MAFSYCSTSKIFVCVFFTVESVKLNAVRIEEEEKVDIQEKEETKNDEKDIDRVGTSSALSSTSSKPYPCRWCMKGFTYKCRMMAHMRRCSLSQECDKQCSQCPKKLPNLQALRRHQAEVHHIVTCKKKVACDVCHRVFAHPSGESWRPHDYPAAFTSVSLHTQNEATFPYKCFYPCMSWGSIFWLFHTFWFNIKRF